MKRSCFRKLIVGTLMLAGLALAGCGSNEVKMVDVPAKDIPKDMYNKPIPPEAFKSMNPAQRKQVKKMEETVKGSASATKDAKGQ